MAKRTKKTTEEDGGVAMMELPVGTQASQLRMQQIAIDQIRFDGKNPRTRMDSSAIDELAASIAANGMQQPIGVSAGFDATGPYFVVVFGHRRLEAAKRLGWTSIPATIVDPDADIAAVRAVENLQREEPDAIETALHVAAVMDESWARACHESGYDPGLPLDAASAKTMRDAAVQMTAGKLGKSPRWVRDQHFLGTLDATTREKIISGKLPAEPHGRELVKIADPEMRAELAKRASIGGSWKQSDYPMPIDDLRALVAEHLRSLGSVPWKLDVPVGDLPACTMCPRNSRNQTGLFDHYAPQYGRHQHGKEPDAGVCLGPACYGRKKAAFTRATISASRKATKAAAEAPKGEKEKAIPAAIKRHTPDFVRESVFVSETKDRIKAAPARGAEKSSARVEKKPKAKTAEQLAKEMLEDAERKWRPIAIEMCEKTARKNPLVAAMLVVLRHADCFDQMYNYAKVDHKKAAELKRLIEVACHPTDLNIEAMARSIGKNDIIRQWDWHKTEYIEHLADCLDIEQFPPRPKLEDFMPKADAGETAEAKPAGRKKAAKKRTKKPAEEVHRGDDE